MGLFSIFKKKVCNHDWKVTERTNVLQQDDMGYPLRLCLIECIKCGESKHRWIDVSEEALKELETGESVLLEWSKV